MKIVLEIDKNTPLKDGDLLVYQNGVVKTVSKEKYLRDLRNKYADQQVQINRLNEKVEKLTNVLKEITK